MTDCSTAAAASSEKLWFMDGAVTILMAQNSNRAGASLVEHRMPEGFSPPVHVHHDEDETFYLLDGVIRFQAGDEARQAGPGEVVHIPAGIPHSFHVLSSGGSRFLTITHGGFETMTRAMGRPALSDDMPEPMIATPAMQAALTDACARNGIAIVGAPMA